MLIKQNLKEIFSITVYEIFAYDMSKRQEIDMEKPRRKTRYITS